MTGLTTHLQHHLRKKTERIGKKKGVEKGVSIATMRTKTEYVVEKDDRGKNSVRNIGLSPVQRDGVEMLLAGDDQPRYLALHELATNALVRQIGEGVHVYRELEKRGEPAIRQILSFLDHPLDRVRCLAADFCYPIAPERCSEALIAISDNGGLMGMDGEDNLVGDLLFALFVPY